MQTDALTLYLVTGRYHFSDEAFLTVIDQACRAGVTMVQLREKEVTTNRYYQLALAVKKITDRYGIPLIIDDRLDVCLAVDAAGLHIGNDELPVAVARRLLGKDKILGVTAKTVERATEAERDGADYLGTGAIFPTQTKKNAPLTSLETLQNICQTVAIPVVAIGGITPERVATFANTPIAGVSVVSDIMLAKDVTAEVTQFRQAIQHILD